MAGENEQDLVAVTIVRNYRNYYPGDVAGFPAGISKQLIAEGFAEKYQAPASKQITGSPTK